jgi:hypothetical protein
MTTKRTLPCEETELESNKRPRNVKLSKLKFKPQNREAFALKFHLDHKELIGFSDEEKNIVRLGEYAKGQIGIVAEKVPLLYHFFASVCNFVRNSNHLNILNAIKSALLRNQIAVIQPMSKEEFLAGLLREGEESTSRPTKTSDLLRMADCLQQIVKCFGNTIDTPDCVQFTKLLDIRSNALTNTDMITVELARPILLEFQTEMVKLKNNNTTTFYRVEEKNCSILIDKLSECLSISEGDLEIAFKEEVYPRFDLSPNREKLTIDMSEANKKTDLVGFGIVSNIGIMHRDENGKYSLKLYCDTLIMYDRNL